MFQLQVEILGEIGKTEKGYIAQYLIEINGKKHVVKCFSKDPEKLIQSGKLTVNQDFFFVR